MKLSRFFAPEYLLRPGQILLRMVRGMEREATGYRTAGLPWGFEIRVNIGETIGSTIWRTGVHDLPVLESLWRLIDPGDGCVDVGANIGLMTNLMAFRSGTGGRVYSLEPHPMLFEELKANVACWSRQAGFAEIQAVEAAATLCEGEVDFEVPDGFEWNRGTGRLQDPSDGKKAALRVRAVRLDGLIQDSRVGVMKVDVEGHELGVLQGCGCLLERQRIRDIVYESFLPQPDPATELLRACGYTVFRVQQRFRGPRPIPLRDATKGVVTENFLATCEPERLEERLGPSGWFCLSGKPSGS